MGTDSAHEPGDARSLIQFRQLAEAAQADAPGPWWYDGRDILHHPDAFDLLVIPLPETWHESQRVSDAVAHYIAAASPDVILGLLDVIEGIPDAVAQAAVIGAKHSKTVRRGD